MKRLSMFLLTVLLIASLFVSCDTNTNAVLDEHVTVSFSTGADGRSLGYEIENISNLKWHYSATKTNPNDDFRFGETDGKPLTSFDTKIELSQGKWDFTLWANKVEASGNEGAKVYEGSVTGVLITHETSPKTIVINVSPEVAGESGSIVLQDITVSLKDGSSTTVYPQVAIIEGVENGELTLTNGCSAEKTGLQAGDYEVTVKYTEVIDGTTVTYASEKIVVTVWSGRTTTIKGNLSEITGSAILDKKIIQTDITQVNSVSEGDTLFTLVGLAPSNNTESSEVKDTVVTFPAGTLSGENAKLQVKVNSIDSDFSFSVPESPSTVGSISLKLNDQESSKFNANVTIETYIAKGLTGVQVYYNDVALNDADVTYESSSGKLTFVTNHFSEYYVVSQKVVALNITQNKAYTDFGTALGEVDSGDIIKLYSDITGDRFSVTKSMTIEGNNKTLTDNATDGRAIWIDATDVTLTINDLTIDGANKCQRGLQVNNLDNGWNNAEITLNKCTIKNITYYAKSLLVHRVVG